MLKYCGTLIRISFLKILQRSETFKVFLIVRSVENIKNGHDIPLEYFARSAWKSQFLNEAKFHAPFISHTCYYQSACLISQLGLSAVHLFEAHMMVSCLQRKIKTGQEK